MDDRHQRCCLLEPTGMSKPSAPRFAGMPLCVVSRRAFFYPRSWLAFSSRSPPVISSPNSTHQHAESQEVEIRSALGKRHGLHNAQVIARHPRLRP